ncbi:MAG: hypothetical protein ACXVKH_00760 [Candidatus Angelobacter sp.]
MEDLWAIFCSEADEPCAKKASPKFMRIVRKPVLNGPDFLDEEEKMSMIRPKPINVFLVAAVSALFHGGVAVLFTPMLSFLMFYWGAAPIQFSNTIAATSDGMVLAVLAPLFFAALGFVTGALVALVHNVFAKDQCRHTLEIEIKETMQPRQASLSHVA